VCASWLASSADAENCTVLPAEDSPKLDDLSVLHSPQLAHLATLSLYACRNLTDLGPIAALPRLQTLMLDRCSWDLTCLSGHTSLEELHLGRSQNCDRCWEVQAFTHTNDPIQQQSTRGRYIKGREEQWPSGLLRAVWEPEALSRHLRRAACL